MQLSACSVLSIRPTHFCIVLTRCSFHRHVIALNPASHTHELNRHGLSTSFSTDCLIRSFHKRSFSSVSKCGLTHHDSQRRTSSPNSTNTRLPVLFLGPLQFAVDLSVHSSIFQTRISLSPLPFLLRFALCLYGATYDSATTSITYPLSSFPCNLVPLTHSHEYDSVIGILWIVHRCPMRSERGCC